MRDRYKIIDNDGIHFMTATIVAWIPVFCTEESFQIITRSLNYCRRERGLKLYAYVVMENHVHLVAAAPELARVMQAFKGFTAREILAWAQRSGKSWLLQQFRFHCKAHKSASTHQVWQEGFHPQLLEDGDIFLQKVDYIHDNPVLRG